MELFYVPDVRLDTERLVLTGPEVRHIVKVLRHRVKDRIFVTDGNGNEVTLELTEVGKTRVAGRVVARKRSPREPRHRVGIAQAILKGDKLAQVVEGVTELGGYEVIPLCTERVVGRMSQTKRERLRHVAGARLESSTRTVLPRIAEPVDITGLTGRMGDYEQTLVAYEEVSGPGLTDVLNRRIGSVLVVIGPEGGFEPGEIDRLKAAGASCFSLGPRRLRAETAAVVAAALCLHALGDLG